MLERGLGQSRCSAHIHFEAVQVAVVYANHLWLELQSSLHLFGAVNFDEWFHAQVLAVRIQAMERDVVEHRDNE